MERTYRFTLCTVRLDYRLPVAETRFLDGQAVRAGLDFQGSTYQTADRDLLACLRQQAGELGYGTDIGAMTLEHEVLHTWLMEKLGYLASPVFWSLTHPKDPPLEPYLDPYAEEELVLDFQRLLNQRSLVRLEQLRLGPGLSLRQLRDEAWALLRCAP